MPVPTHIYRPLHEGVPGNVTVSVTAFMKGDPRFQRANEQGGDRGGSLAQLREKFNGDEGEMKDLFLGLTHHISLAPWADSDPDTTYINIKFRFVPDVPIKKSPLPDYRR